MNKISILYVEINKIKNTEYKEKLKSTFINNFYETSNEIDALTLHKKYSPSIVLIDVDTPTINGLNIASEIRQKCKNTKIIILSTLTDTETLLKAIPLNLSDYLLKPLCKVKLTNTILKLAQQNDIDTQNLITINQHLKYNTKLKKLYDNNIEVKLTKNEIRLLEFFLKNQNSIIESNIIFDYMWDDFNYNMQNLRSLVNRLNKKLSSKIIFAKYGQGYILNK